MTATTTCSNCRFYVKPHADWKITDEGACQRWPPSAIWNPTEERPMFFWPTVGKDTWCGEFQFTEEILDGIAEESIRKIEARKAEANK